MTTPQPAAHRQTRYVAAPPLDPPVALPLPELTSDIEQAKLDLTEYGMCLLDGVLSSTELDVLRTKLDRQAAAERALGELAPPNSSGTKQLVSNMVNKGSEFLALVEKTESDELAGYLLGKDFLISSITGGIFHGQTTEPQPLHRDQGQVPATADFAAACNLFWLLDDFTPDRGSTCVVPGSHRWKPEYLVNAPPREMAVQIEAPAGSVFAWDGRLWHGTGVNVEGHTRRQLTTFFCLPWMRQQENWGVSCLQEVLDEASPKLKVRLGLKTYGTLGGVSGTLTSQATVSLGNSLVSFPEFIIGEDGALHPLQRVSRAIKTN
ncbi:MAG: phytanoyl-CoA dioxygenase family protein [Gammaproteobacteria bacterium]|nr:phytanoyl-CoA dioxygenase family protein [Gammaproteobacteria bacterium]MCZ6856088.1 phytanoyl-CoA dioxygenase family protein [Gammaproteobacteria bacterium]